jgi:hypothetical protein
VLRVDAGSETLQAIKVAGSCEVKCGCRAKRVEGALHEANRIAAETFACKGTAPFDIERAEAIVERVRQSLVDQGFR